MNQNNLDPERLMQFINAPVTTNVKRKVLVARGKDGQQQALLYEIEERTIVTPDRGVINLTTARLHQPDDGTPIGGIAKCQNCGRVVAASSLRRCSWCAKTVCLYCATVDGGRCYCGFWHSVWAGLFGNKI